MKSNKITKWLKDYAEFIVYGVILAGIMSWQVWLYANVASVYQDLIVAAFSLQILNIILTIAVAKKMRLLAQFLLLTAILFGAVVIYYIEVLIANVI